MTAGKGGRPPGSSPEPSRILPSSGGFARDLDEVSGIKESVAGWIAPFAQDIQQQPGITGIVLRAGRTNFSGS
jgi:hypothetical protein